LFLRYPDSSKPFYGAATNHARNYQTNWISMIWSESLSILLVRQQYIVIRISSIRQKNRDGILSISQRICPFKIDIQGTRPSVRVVYFPVVNTKLSQEE